MKFGLGPKHLDLRLMTKLKLEKGQELRALLVCGTGNRKGTVTGPALEGHTGK
jgi:hypothetical protein